MTFDEYQNEALKTLQTGADIVYLASKLTIEAAEVAQPVIKWRYHGRAFEVSDIAEELGDLLWYMATLADAFGMTLEDVAQGNIDKLRKRHGEKYNAAHYQVA